MNFGYLDRYVILGIYVHIHVIWIVYVSLIVIKWLRVITSEIV